MADPGITVDDKSTLISPNAPVFVGRPVIYYSFLDTLPNLNLYETFAGWQLFFGAGSNQNSSQPYFSSFNDPTNALGKAGIKEIFGNLESILNVQFKEATGTQTPDVRFGITDQSAARAGGASFRSGALNDVYLDWNNLNFGLGQYGYLSLLISQ